MKTTRRLIAEHDLIERALTVLERAVSAIEAGQAPPQGFPAWAVEFFRNFADGCHHAKEEELFFPRLKERGIPEEGGPIGVMLYEHTVGRDCVGRMASAVEAEPFDAEGFAAAAREYIPLLRNHIFKENNVLFKMAERVLTDQDDAEIDRRFSEVEQERATICQMKRYGEDVARWE